MCYVSFLVVDNELSSENILICILILEHFHSYTSTIPENSQARLDVTHCSNVKEPSVCEERQVIRLIVALFNLINESALEYSTCSRMRTTRDYFRSQNEEKPFSDSSLFVSLDFAKKYDALKALIQRYNSSNLSDLPEDFEIESFKVKLASDATLVCVYTRKYLKEPHEFMHELVNKLTNSGIAYFNAGSPWACALLRVLKPAPSKLLFTSDLRAVKW